MNKILIVGIDGAAFKLVKAWRNDFPNINKLINNGVFGKMSSTIPPLTSPAWNCLYTGKNPGKIGIFDFIDYPIRKNNINIVNSATQEVQSFWEIMGNNGVKVGVVNAAVTYPPKPVNGYLICGFGTPWGKGSYSYPDFLTNILKEKFDYEITSPMSLFDPDHEEKYFQSWIGITRKRLDSLKWLIKNYPCDCLFATFFATDSAQHYCWHHIDKDHPKYNHDKASKYREHIKKVYMEVDSAIGKLLKEVDEGGSVFIVSDHGFYSCYGTFNINSWLEKNGFLKFKNNLELKQSNIIALKNFIMGFMSENVIKSIIKYVPDCVLKLFKHDTNRSNMIQKLLNSIDWESTYAYAVGNMGQIFLNVKGREENGIVTPDDYETIRDSIINKLRATKDPYVGRNIFTHIYKREDIYTGKYLDRAPDIVFILENFMQTIETNTIWNNTPPLTGTHDMDAIFIGSGNGIKKGHRIDGISIYDVAPTLLHMLNCPIPHDVDGKVMKHIFEEKSDYYRREIVYKSDFEKEALKKKISSIKKSKLA